MPLRLWIAGVCLHCDRNARIGKHLNFRPFRKWDCVFFEFLNHHLYDFLNVLESLFPGVAPRCRPILFEYWAVCVPTIVIRLHHDFECIGLHGVADESYR